MQTSISGFHGTDINNVDSILSSEFNPSIGDDHWIGDGVYYFIDGLSDPFENAWKWVKHERKKNNCQIVGILKSSIEYNDENLLDLRTKEGVRILRLFTECFVNRISETGKKIKIVEGKVINMARSEQILQHDIFIGDFKIKFNFERPFNFLRTNNVTICCVNNTDYIKQTQKIGEKILES